MFGQVGDSPVGEAIQRVYKKDQQDKEHDRAHDKQAELGGTAIKFGVRTPRCEALGNCPK
jgi:hypothetical protein